MNLPKIVSQEEWSATLKSKLERWKAKRGWEHIRWYSSNDGDFDYDFGVTIDASRGFDEFNFRTLDEYAAMGQESMKTSDQPYDMPGRTCFLQVDGRVFRTYSQYARGPESTGGSYGKAASFDEYFDTAKLNEVLGYE